MMAMRVFMRSRHVDGVDKPAVLERVALEGTCDEGALEMTVQAGDLHYDVSRRLPDRVTMGDEFTPQAMLPGLYEGRRWTVPIYNPLRAAHAPLDILLAEVGGEDILYWDNRLVRVDVVTYREDSSTASDPRCRLWVDKEGRVLKQEAAILNARVAFVRRSAEATAWLLREGGLGGATPEAPGAPAAPRPARDRVDRSVEDADRAVGVHSLTAINRRE
jgi:hypothetical protein